jgi:hypothetical protein
MAYIDPSNAIPDKIDHDLAPYDKEAPELRMSYKQLKAEYDRICVEFAREAHAHWLLRLEHAKCQKKK